MKKVTLFAVTVSCLAGIGLALAESRSGEFNYTGIVNVTNGFEYIGKVYPVKTYCIQQCIAAGCNYFAFSEENGGGINCIQDLYEAELPRGRWNIYGYLPGKFHIKL